MMYECMMYDSKKCTVFSRHAWCMGEVLAAMLQL